jgi:hypothetical protein
MRTMVAESGDATGVKRGCVAAAEALMASSEVDRARLVKEITPESLVVAVCVRLPEMGKLAGVKPCILVVVWLSMWRSRGRRRSRGSIEVVSWACAVVWMEAEEKKENKEQGSSCRRVGQ